MMDDFSLARPAGHLIMGDGSGPDGLAKKDAAKALSGAESVDTATIPLDIPSRTKNLIIESIAKVWSIMMTVLLLIDSLFRHLPSLVLDENTRR